jgi:hypothetical protein
MATMFRKGDTVKLVVTVPQGPVESMRMNENGDVQYLVSWTDANGVQQSRWFDEAQLTAV